MDLYSWRRMTGWLFVFVQCLLLTPAAGAPLSRSSPALKMLLCDSCQVVMRALGKDVKYLVETSKMWKPQDLQERIMISCEDPAIAKGAGKEACGFLVTDYHKVIADEVALRWTEDSEEFEEDIVPKDFCLKVRICKEDQKSLSEMLSSADKQEKQKKEAKLEKEAKERKEQAQRTKMQKPGSWSPAVAPSVDEE